MFLDTLPALAVLLTGKPYISVIAVMSTEPVMQILLYVAVSMESYLVQVIQKSVVQDQKEHIVVLIVMLAHAHQFLLHVLP